jgi:hypothetical protein
MNFKSVLMKKLLVIPVLLLSTLAIGQRGHVERAVEDKYEDKYGKPGEDKLNGWMNGHVLNVKLEPEYVFPTSMTMQLQDYKRGEKKGDPTDVQYFLNPAKNYFGTSSVDNKKKNETFMIYEIKANYMVMLDTKKMAGMAMNLNAFMSGKAIAEREKKIESGEVKDGKHDCKKTGKTKTILGYSCDEYVCTDEEKGQRSEMWMTNKIPVDITQANMRGPYAAYFRKNNKMTGMMMEATFYKDDVIQSTMLVTEVNNKANRKEVMANYKMN